MFKNVVSPPNCTTALRIELHLFTADEAEDTVTQCGTNTAFTTKHIKHAGRWSRKYGSENAQDVQE